VTGPGPNGGTRRTRFNINQGAVLTITDPDGRFVSFGYNTHPGFDIITRVNRNGYGSEFSLVSHRLVESNVPLADPNQDAIITICPAEIRGLPENGCDGGSVALDSAVTVIDGPRVDANDMSRVRTDRFGAPAVITDPLGNHLRLFRGHRGLAGLVTRVIHKNGWVNDARYDDRGLLAARVEYGPLGPGQDAVTTYTWDPKWERVKSVTFPELNSVSFEYDTATGNRSWQQAGTDVVRRVNFAYYTTGSGDRLLRSVTYPEVRAGRTDRDSVEYDALGNPATVRTLQNATTLSISRFVSDAAGRQTSVCADIVINGAKQCTVTAFDIMDRDSVVTATGDAVNSVAAQSVVVSTTFNAEGNPRAIVRDPSDGPLQPQTMRRGYDQGERLIADTASDGSVERRFYDEASNLVRIITRRGDTLTMTYDAMNRLETRTMSGRLFPKETVGLAAISPNSPQINPPYPRKPNDPNGYLVAAETHQFDYNELGLITSARNPSAHVARAYFANGMLASETDSIRTVAGGDLSQHIYRVGYDYDLNGRLRALHYRRSSFNRPITHAIPSRTSTTFGPARSHASTTC
jgi:YD repeat-containing protein